MRFTRLSLVALALIARAAVANEHAAPPAGEHGGAQAAPPRDQKEFSEKTVKLNALAAKLEESRKHFEDLVKEKEEIKSPEAKVPVLKEMVENAKQREKDQREYDKLRSEIAQRYPNQGNHVNRHVEKPAGHGEHGEHGGHDEPARDEHAAGGHEEPAPAHHAEQKPEVAPTLDGLLDETKRLIDRKYAPFMPRTEAASPRAPAAVGEKKRHERLRLER